jgi:hypothetical protein
MLWMCFLWWNGCLPAPLLQEAANVLTGFELGWKEENKYYIRNHLQFIVLVHPTRGEYHIMPARIDAAAGTSVTDRSACMLMNKQCWTLSMHASSFFCPAQACRQ